MQNKNTRRGFTQINKSVVICPPCGESQGQRPQSRKVGMREPGKGVVNKATLLDNPPSARGATSPTLGGKSTTRGFTLIELLVVVLIIGILAAVALPQYQKAVLKSRFSALMPIAKAVREAQEVYFLENGKYSTSLAELEIQATNDASTQITIGNSSGHEYIQASSNNISNKYTIYLDHSANFAGNIYCEAPQDDALANAVCVAVGGINGTKRGNGYIFYLIAGNSTGTVPYEISGFQQGRYLGAGQYATEPIYSNGEHTVSYDPNVSDKAIVTQCDQQNNCTTTHYSFRNDPGVKTGFDLCKEYPFLTKYCDDSGLLPRYY